MTDTPPPPPQELGGARGRTKHPRVDVVDEITALEGWTFESFLAMVLVDTVKIGAVCPTENPPPLPALPKWRVGGMTSDDRSDAVL